MGVDPKDKLFCEIAIDLDFITQEHANKALESQKIDEAISQKKRVGAYLHQMGLLTKEQIGTILKMQDKVEASQDVRQAPAAVPEPPPPRAPVPEPPPAPYESARASPTPVGLITAAWICVGVSFLPLGRISLIVGLAILVLAIILVVNKNQAAKINGYVLIGLWVITFIIGFMSAF